jgi:hypothetical protein
MAHAQQGHRVVPRESTHPLDALVTFTRVSNWAELSTCSRYSVSAMKQGDAYGFQAWLIGKPSEIIYTGTVEQCRQACRDHASGISTAPELYQPGDGGGR